MIIVQPWPKLFTERGSENGGNVLGLERFDKNLIRTLPLSTWYLIVLTMLQKHSMTTGGMMKQMMSSSIVWQGPSTSKWMDTRR